METEGLSFPEAVERLAALAGLPLPVETQRAAGSRTNGARRSARRWSGRRSSSKSSSPAPAGREARAYLDRRQISVAAREKFRLGFAPPERHALRDHLAAKGASVETMIEAGLLVHGEDIAVPYDRFRNRVMFPICDRAGRVIAFGGRAMEADAQAKYLNSPETPLFHKGATLYNLHNARKAAHETRSGDRRRGLCRRHRADRRGLSATPSRPLGTALTPEQCALLWRLAEEPILCFDGDKAGLKAAFRAVDTALPLIGPGPLAAIRPSAGRPGPGRTAALRRGRGAGGGAGPARCRSSICSGCARPKRRRWTRPSAAPPSSGGCARSSVRSATRRCDVTTCQELAQRLDRLFGREPARAVSAAGRARGAARAVAGALPTRAL